MATLYITEYLRQGFDSNGQRVPAGEEPAIAEQNLVIGGSSIASNAFNVNTHFVRIHTDSICSLAFGTAPTAVTTAKRMAANDTEFFAVVPGNSMKVAVIANT